MRTLITILLLFLIVYSCKETKNPPTSEIESSQSPEIRFATGFQMEKTGDLTVLTISNPWPDSEESFRYALTPQPEALEDPDSYDAVVKTPVRSLVVTSTTHIPSLEMLESDQALVGFPNLNYISSEQTRKRIDAGEIRELGKNEDINTEVLVDLQPEAVITFAVSGGNKSVTSIQKTGIPVLYNADWVETHPLGKAEWIKFFGALFQKEEQAERIFSEIEERYFDVKKIAAQSEERPTVLSGAMYKDVWYLPQGESWAAQFINDANGEYLWAESTGTGSLSLNLEAVLEKAQNAQYWVGPGQFTSYSNMEDSHSVYGEFKAFQNKQVYSFTNRKGPTGGVLYYELAPNRPDIVLQDIIKILHPELLPEHELYFFRPLE